MIILKIMLGVNKS